VTRSSAHYKRIIPVPKSVVKTHGAYTGTGFNVQCWKWTSRPLFWLTSMIC
jgi:hypothetical protein